LGQKRATSCNIQALITNICFSKIKVEKKKDSGSLLVGPLNGEG
jgi:hypothetical protein